MQVDQGRATTDYEKLSQVTSWIKQAKDSNVPEVAEARAKAKETIKYRLNQARPPQESLAHFQRREAEL
eukprot:11185890-Alexandrium_andersonii.AAC.1